MIFDVANLLFQMQDPSRFTGVCFKKGRCALQKLRMIDLDVVQSASLGKQSIFQHWVSFISVVNMHAESAVVALHQCPTTKFASK